jgi:hypothetical protein
MAYHNSHNITKYVAIDYPKRIAQRVTDGDHECHDFRGSNKYALRSKANQYSINCVADCCTHDCATDRCSVNCDADRCTDVPITDYCSVN